MKTIRAAMLCCFASGFVQAQVENDPPQGAKIISLTGNVDRLGPCGTADKPLARGDLLLNTCQLTATDPSATVQIECTNGATLQPLTGGFIAIVNGTGVPSCVLQLKLGGAMATSSGDANEQGSASIETGALAAVVTHTSVIVNVPAAGAGETTAYVVDGEAAVTRAGETTNLVAGKMTYANSKAVSDIPRERLQWVANNLAIASTSGAGVQVSAQAQKELSDRYLAVYSDSHSQVARQKLTQSLAAVNAPSNAFTRYQSVQAAKLVAGQGNYLVDAGSQSPPAPAAAQEPTAAANLAVIVGHAAVAAMANQSKFTDPKLNGRRVDYCLHWGAECGSPAADAFCRAKDFSRSADFKVAEDIGAQTPTLVIGDDRVCSAAACDGFAFIRCE